MSRLAGLATVSLYVDKASEDIEVVLQRALGAIEEAASYNADLVVLPEEFDYYGLTKEGRDRAGEIIPGGPVQKRMQEAAKKYGINLVFGLREIEGDIKYNSAVVIDRNGCYVGKYRKTHLAPGESSEVVAGCDYPVFKLDFGTIGITLCMEIHYPEIFTILALQGADVIVHPTMWIDYNGNLNETLVNARAIDNQIYMVTSHFIQMPFLSGRAMGHSRIVDPHGRTRADTSHRPGVAFARVDLDETFEYWAQGELKERYPTLKECFLGMRKPETYGILTRPDTENSWRIKEPKLYMK